jgi:DNA-binding NarL/FixJ family response regulator
VINLFIVDDHAIVRRGLKQIIADVSDMQVIHEAANGDEALTVINKNVDVILLDISMPGKNILDLIKSIKAGYPKLPILILSMYPEEQYALQMLRYGANGYLNKDSAPEELVVAIRKVASGEQFLSAAMKEKMLFSFNKPEELPHKKLSNREFQVFLELSKGKRISEIAHEMSRSVKTASTYRTRVMEKMGIESTAEIIQYATQHQLTLS